MSSGLIPNTRKDTEKFRILNIFLAKAKKADIVGNLKVSGIAMETTNIHFKPKSFTGHYRFLSFIYQCQLNLLSIPEEKLTKTNRVCKHWHGWHL